MKTSAKVSVASPTVLADCQSLAASKLKAKYRSTYTSWRDMKAREKTHGAVIAPNFVTFAGFLSCVGPRPSKKHTLDRLDNTNKEYGPGLVAWRTVTAQNSNKSDTVFLTDSDGTTLPLMAWAKKLKISPNTLYSRRKAGWTDVEILHGKKAPPPESPAAVLTRTPWPPRRRESWERAFQEQFVSSIKPITERCEFLINQMPEYLKSLSARIDQLCSNLPDDEDYPLDEGMERDLAALNKAQALYDEYLAHLQLVQRRHLLDRKRAEFVARKGGLGMSAEGLLFDQFSDPDVT